MPSTALRTDPDAPLIEAHDVSLSFGGREVLQHVDLSLRSGDIITLIGPNGAGKTSLLRILLGLQVPTSGSVARRPGLRIGYMPQRVAIDPVLPLTVRRFLGLGGRYGRAQLIAALEESGVPHLLDQPVQSVSGGEMQRVLLARALLREPDLLVLDEPAQGVDVTGQGEVFRLIAQLRDRHGCGVLMVSHELHLVMAAADSVLCLNRHVCCTGRPEAVSRHPEYLRLFGPMDTRGLAVYTHHHDHHHAPDGSAIYDDPDKTPCDECVHGDRREEAR
ncbi:MAG: zinc ABC transporter ATP-binding protein ZnuC [Chromatiales bacterium]|jgi:zinc transport system ATP-binding protein|nr:zinc ABC transporter ATP-binding protein ZnuC [Chromatiales bacterium]MDX9767081.1 zinc ABC transporter ATP-binding protein ZnuC [Ectothiorhodospiraceae bacterium]